VYKLLLCWRYLKTRYLALACIISVMLGVATLIVVNSVMSGFSTKLRERLHGLLSDVVIESHGVEGFEDPTGKMAKIRSIPDLNKRIEAMSATMEVVAMLQYPWGNSGEFVNRPVKVIGVEEKTRTALGGFKEHLVHQAQNAEVSFALPEEMKDRYRFEQWRLEQELRRLEEPRDPNEPPPVMPMPREVRYPCGIIVGNLIASYRKSDVPEGEPQDTYLFAPGTEVKLFTLGSMQSNNPKAMAVYDNLVVVDFFKSGMSEYDAQYVFVPLDYLQRLRSLQNRATSIQIKLKDYSDAEAVVDALERLFPSGRLTVQTWEKKQGALLQAIAIEKGILNVLLFLIIAVAGFGILAIFSMIVAEKTRDIGVLKALGASNGGVMRIFLGYGLLLGVVGAGLGTLLGLTITNNINAVEQFISGMTGRHIFDPSVYYFTEIPTDIQVWSVVLVNLGSVAIAVVFSILPALRAAWLHPVRALRYE
jgi:lipoprotein-releasing system permease protein